MGLCLQAAGYHSFIIGTKHIKKITAEGTVVTILGRIPRQFSSASATWDPNQPLSSDKGEVEKFLLEQVPFTFEVKGL